MLANRMNGSLTVIVGQCDLILQMSDLPEPVKQGLEAIKQVALSTANGINSYQCRISPEPDWPGGQIPISSNQTPRPPMSVRPGFAKRGVCPVEFTRTSLSVNL